MKTSTAADVESADGIGASVKLTDRFLKRAASGACERRSPKRLRQHAGRCTPVEVATLPERDREILTLTAWEGLTPKEVAAVVGIPTNLVRVRLHRARARLAGRLASARAHRPRAEMVIVEHEG